MTTENQTPAQQDVRRRARTHLHAAESYVLTANAAMVDPARATAYAQAAYFARRALEALDEIGVESYPVDERRALTVLSEAWAKLSALAYSEDEVVWRRAQRAVARINKFSDARSR